jgi:hypothetical protein
LLVIFGMATPGRKALSLAPFALFIPFVAYSFTDSVWTFFLVLSAALWNRSPSLSFLATGLAGATKQVALITAPFLLVRAWNESRRKSTVKLAGSAMIVLAGFLVPNIPFLISSPGDWWASVITPYLPNGVPQVPGGIGLSELFLGLGILPSPFFFTLMTATAGAASLYVYYRWPFKTGYFVWLFPPFIMLFYYRSFFNYIFYWAFPAILEAAGRTNRASPLRSGPEPRRLRLRPLLGPGFRRLRTRAAAVILIAMSVTVGLSSVYGVLVSNGTIPRVDVRINGLLDNDSIGAITSLNVTLNNHTPNLVYPSFFVKWNIQLALNYLLPSFLPQHWDSNSTGLPPRSNQSYLVSATDGFSAIPPDVSFRVFVFDSQTKDIVGQSPWIVARPIVPLIANPFFRWWTLDSSAGVKVPFGWKLSLTTGDSTMSGISQDPAGGVDFQLGHSTGGYEQAKVTLSQKTLFNDTSVSVELLDVLNSATSNAFVGASVSDGAHTLFYIFSTTITSPKTYLTPDNTTILVPVPYATWSTVSLDTQRAWQAQSWIVPRESSFSLFLESKSPGFSSATIKELTP